MRYPLFLPVAVALVTGVLESGAIAGGFAIAPGVAGLSQAGAIVADAQPVSSYAYNPAGMVFFPGTRFALEVLGQRPTYTYSGPAGSSGPGVRTSILGDIFVTHRFDSLPLSVGLGITSPYFFHNSWASGSLYPGSPDLNNTLRIVDFNPGISYMLLPNLAIAAGVDYYQDIGGRFGQITASGGGVGGNVGIFYTTERFNLGLSYQSGATLGTGASRVSLPDQVRVGMRYRWTRALATELDVDWTGWNSARLPYYGSLGWKSALGYHLGVSYHINRDLQIRGGLAHEDSPAGPEAIQLAMPATSANVAAFGVGVGLGVWHYDLGASYALSGKSGGVALSRPLPVPAASYKASALTFGVAISRHF